MHKYFTIALLAQIKVDSSRCKVGQILRRHKNEQNNYTPNCIIQLKVSVDNYFVHIFEDGTKFKIHSRLQPHLLLKVSKS
jgi:predicted transcriptional regulator